MREDDALVDGEARSAHSRAVYELLAATFMLLFWYAESGVGINRGISVLELLPLVFNSFAWLLWAVGAYFSLFRYWAPRAYDLGASDYVAILRRRRELLIAKTIDVLVALQFISLAFSFQRLLQWR